MNEAVRSGKTGRRRLQVVVAVVALVASSTFAVQASAAVTPVHKSLARAIAQASGRASAHGAGQGGGHGSARPVGRATVPRTKSIPKLSRVQRAQRASIAHRPVFTPRMSARTAAGVAGNARPTGNATAAAHGARASGRSSADGDLNYFRSTDVTSATGGSASSVDEPSVANDGNVVLYTGNWYAALSTDSGNSFSYLNPYSMGPTPTLPTGSFCCDQVAIHSPTSNDVTVWALLYCNITNCNTGTGDNIIRLAVARNQSDLASSTFDFYDLSAQTFGFPEGDWIDYPHMETNGDSVYLTVNIFNGETFQDSLIVRFSLSSLAAGSAGYTYYYRNDSFTFTPVDNSTDNWGYWASTQYGNGGFVRVFNWAPGTNYTSIAYNDFAPSFNFEQAGAGSCAAPDSTNWCGDADSRVLTGGEVGSSTVSFMWNAGQGGGFAYPYTFVASFDVHTGPATSMTTTQIWNGSYAWQYPGMGVDAAGNQGVSIAVGGGTWGYPGSQFLIKDDLTGGGYAASSLATGARATARWGDYLTARAATGVQTLDNSWVVAGYTYQSDGIHPAFYWIGRQRDDPFAPNSATDYSPTFSEGAAQTVDSGVFYGPSHCTCDYTASTDWGDGASSSSTVSNYPGFPGWMLISDTHTYGEEGSYPSTVTAQDGFSHSSSGTGSNTVNDAALHAAGVSKTKLVGTAFTTSVANFTDDDPAGAVSDYTATIDWGDGSTSAGTIGSGFAVTGTHTYTGTGTKTVTTTINDLGGASTTATSTITVVSRPVVTSVSPRSGPLAGGRTVTILGHFFSGATSVKFGNTPATGVTVVSATKITAVSPAHAAGTTDVRVTTPVGTSAVVPADHYTYQAAPTITAVSPTHGTHSGGTTVTITGTNFVGASSVRFATTSATSFTVVSPTKITAVSPAHVAGLINVRVTTPTATSAVTAADHYTYT